MRAFLVHRTLSTRASAPTRENTCHYQAKKCLVQSNKIFTRVYTNLRLIRLLGLIAISDMARFPPRTMQPQSWVRPVPDLVNYLFPYFSLKYLISPRIRFLHLDGIKLNIFCLSTDTQSSRIFQTIPSFT